MRLSPDEAALILGDTRDRILEMQTEGYIPDPIPDDYFDVAIPFRIGLEKAMRAKVDRQRGIDANQD